MNYYKPQVIFLGSATEAVKGGKALGYPADSLPNYKTTMRAYEADE